MNIGQTLDVRAHINARKMSGYQWLLLALCFLIVATDGMDVAIMGSSHRTSPRNGASRAPPSASS